MEEKTSMPMDLRVNREIKAFCPDFAPVREALRSVGAAFVEVKEQVDYFYHLPPASDPQATRRLKLRMEPGKRQIIYYHDRQEHGGRTSQYQPWEISDRQVQDVLDRVLGVKAVVRKQRELWRKDNAIFNLDSVEGVGQVFEVEVMALAGRDADRQLAEYRELFGPFIGPYIHGSNEDLVSDTLAAHDGLATDERSLG